MIMSGQVFASGLDSFAPVGQVTASKYNEAQLVDALGKGNTCVKQGQKTFFHSKNITKAHCRMAKALGLTVISVNNLEIDLLKKITGLK